MQNLALRMKELVLNHFYFLIFSLIALIVFGIWWLAFFPGFMSPDSIDQWGQINTQQLSNWHPYIHTLYLFILRKIWDSPAIISLFQLISTSCLFGYIFSFSLKYGVKKRIIVVLFLLFITSIPVAVYSISLWKDTAFSLAILSCCFYFAKLKLTEKQWTNRQLTIVLVLSTLTIFFRHNGLMYIFVFPLLALTFFFSSQKKRVLQYIISLGIVFLILNNILPYLLSVKPHPFWFSRLFLYQATAGFYARLPNASLTPGSKAAMESIMPGKLIKERYNPINTNPMIIKGHNPDINIAPLLSHAFWDQITRDFFSQNLKNNFQLFIADKNAMMYAVLTGQAYAMDNTIAQNNFGLKFTPILKGLNHPLNQFLEWMLKDTNTGIRALIWSTWCSLIILITLTIAAFMRGKSYFLIFSLGLLVQVPALYIFNVANDWRYLYFIYLSVFIAIPLWLIPHQDKIKIKQ